jgi:hypothetical protein
LGTQDGYKVTAGENAKSKGDVCKMKTENVQTQVKLLLLAKASYKEGK